MASIGWTYPRHEWLMDPDASDPPPLIIAISKAGFRDERRGFLIDSLTRESEVFQLQLGKIALGAVPPPSPSHLS